MSNGMEAKMEKVLRAMDVIPPFDHHCELPGRADNEEVRVPTPMNPPMERSPGDEARLVMFSDEELPPTEEAGEAIPTLDLGEKILAEQRRAIARTRRGPGAGPLEPSEFGDKARQELAELVVASDEVAQLQQIVADIVARDIERLCQGLRR